MEDKIELNKILNTYEELKEVALVYNNSINLENIKYLASPSLKYALYNLNLFEVFDARLKTIKLDIENIKKNLKNYKGKEIKINEENKRMDEASEMLRKFEREAKDAYDFYKVYLVKVAKKYDELNNILSEKVYVKSSEEIIFSRIKYYLSCEKYFLIYNDTINLLRSFFNN